ncbi:hypothetical protein [Nocardioides sp. R-C-SC26]|uniref:hypothetical protein n=1 Tax=Nocardioides sp. R-C-SC26 TaxID=2870414 RepID=UPI001E4B6E20|nr:hypothetical protein [Nocardioides sp. R-C-SC26]
MADIGSLPDGAIGAVPQMLGAPILGVGAAPSPPPWDFRTDRIAPMAHAGHQV